MTGDGRRRRTHNRHSRDGGNPQRGAGDGFPSPPARLVIPERRESSVPRRAAGAPTIVIPSDGLARSRTCGYNDERRHRRPVDATAARGPDARWIEAAGGATDVSELR